MASSSESWGRGPNNDGPPGFAGSAAAGRPRRDETGALDGCGSVTSGPGARGPLLALPERLLATGSAARGSTAAAAPRPARELPERRLLAGVSFVAALAARSDLRLGRDDAASERLDGRWLCPRWLSELRFDVDSTFSAGVAERERPVLALLELLAGARRLERGSLDRRRPRLCWFLGRSCVSQSG
jgi:hypothetical protein